MLWNMGMLSGVLEIMIGGYILTRKIESFLKDTFMYLLS